MEDKLLTALKELRDLCAMRAAMWKNDLIEVGEFTYGRPIVHQWDLTTKLKIGKFCSIAGNVHILLGGEHRTDSITTYPFDVLLEEKPTPSKGDVIIGNDVWIGENVTILSGVTIGDGAVIAAGSVVSKNVAPYEIYGGVPAKFIRYRKIAHNVKPPKWWDWPLEKIAAAVPLLEGGDLSALAAFSEGWDDYE